MRKLLFILVLIFCNHAISSTNSGSIIDEPNPCDKSYTFEVSGKLTEESIKKMREYFSYKKGICEVRFNLENKTVTFKTTSQIDEESVKFLVLQARINFVEPEDE